MAYILQVNGDYDEMSNRRKMYKIIESLHVAREWVEQSSKFRQQREEKMRAGIGTIFFDGYHIIRTTNIIRCFWNRLSREAQNYISAPEKARR